MLIEPLGDSAFIIRDLPGPAFTIAEAISNLYDPRILDVNASYETIGVYTSPGALPTEDLQNLLSRTSTAEICKPKTHDIPILYDGEDLQMVAKQLRITEGDVAAAHCSYEYQCYAIGFCPGFPYLGWLPERLQGVPRMTTPRTRTEPGSVGITGKQTGIYPLARPGGWPIIGRTPITLVDVDDNYLPIRAGDIIMFAPLLDEKEFLKLKGERL